MWWLRSDKRFKLTWYVGSSVCAFACKWYSTCVYKCVHTNISTCQWLVNVWISDQVIWNIIIYRKFHSVSQGARKTEEDIDTEYISQYLSSKLSSEYQKVYNFLNYRCTRKSDNLKGRSKRLPWWNSLSRLVICWRFAHQELHVRSVNLYPTGRKHSHWEDHQT